MVTIAILENSVTDIINAGLTKKYFMKNDVETQIHFINENKINHFWNNVKKYTNKNDDTLIIINIPLPHNETLQKLELEPYEKTIFYLPSKKLSITESNKKILFDKGIVTMKQRENYKCFYGHYKRSIVNTWMKFCRLISFEFNIPRIYKKTKLILDGIINISLNNKELAIEKILENDISFFFDEGEFLSVDSKIRDCKKQGFLLFNSAYSGISLLRASIQEFLKTKLVPIGIKGENEYLLLTSTPNFTNHILHECKFRDNFSILFGNGAAIFFNENDYDAFFITIGKTTPIEIMIRYDEPTLVHERTLKRRLIGGPGPEGRRYHGLNEKYPNLIVDGKYVVTPRNAIEEVIDILTESGSSYKIVI